MRDPWPKGRIAKKDACFGTGWNFFFMPSGLVIVGKGSHRQGDKNKWA